MRPVRRLVTEEARMVVMPAGPSYGWGCLIGERNTHVLRGVGVVPVGHYRA